MRAPAPGRMRPGGRRCMHRRLLRLEDDHGAERAPVDLVGVTPARANPSERLPLPRRIQLQLVVGNAALAKADSVRAADLAPADQHGPAVAGVPPGDARPLPGATDER